MNKKNLLCTLLAASLAVASAQAQTGRFKKPGGPQLRIPPVSTLAAPDASQQQAVDFIVAVVNSEPITNNELNVKRMTLEQQLMQQGIALPPRSALLAELLERTILERAQLQLAAETGVKIEDTVLNTALKNIAEQNQISVSELQRRVKATGGAQAFEELKTNIRNELLLNRIREREVDSKVKVTEKDIDDLMTEQKSAFEPTAATIELAQIFIPVPEKSTPTQIALLHARAQLALERAKSGTDFEAVVKSFSEGPERSIGGRLGLRAADRYPPLFVEATKNTPVGDFAGPIRSEAGFHVLKVLEKNSPQVAGIRVTQTRARHILLRVEPTLSEAQARARLADFKQKILAGKTDFATLARANGQDGTAPEGGDLGWASPGQFVPEFEKIMSTLEPGQIADPFTSRFGVHLVQVLERRQTVVPAREYRENLRGLIREKKIEAELATWEREVRGRAYVEYRDSPV